MTDLERFPDRSSQVVRRGSRAVSRNRVTAQVRVSEIQAETDITDAKVENLTMATGNGMRAVLRVCQLQEAMERISPAASGKLAQLADDQALGVSELLSDLRRELRRR